MISSSLRRKVRGALKEYPAIFKTVRAGAQLAREASALTKLSYSRLTTPRQEWQNVLPVQDPTKIDLKIDIRGWCSARELPQGHDSWYLSPGQWANSPVAFLQSYYPSKAGIKIAKNQGGIHAHYMCSTYGRAMAQKRSFKHLHQTITLNYLHLKNIAPRLYDLIDMGDTVAYVVEHLDSDPLRPNDCADMIASIKALVDEDRIEFVSSYGWTNPDFQPPNCSGNLIRCGDRICYVDVHNFILKNYERTLKDIAFQASSASHFGCERGVLGGQFLYQAIPGVPLPAKRSPTERMEVYDRLLETAGLSLAGKTVFDIGGNLGLMGAEYLRRGAHWVHLWDMPQTIENARCVLLAIGCTRFSLTSGSLEPETDMASQIPEHVDGADSVLSYLAIRGHIGWLPALRDIPWKHMIYEGHQDDDSLQTYIQELNQLTPVKVLATSRVSDSFSSSRDVAIIERL